MRLTWFSERNEAPERTLEGLVIRGEPVKRVCAWSESGAFLRGHVVARERDDRRATEEISNHIVGIQGIAKEAVAAIATIAGTIE